MNKHDWILIIIILIISGILGIASHLFNSSMASNANVYYDNKLVQTIDLSSDELKEYTIKGYNGNVVIETKKNMIRVKEEISPLHICSKQGWVTSSLEPIICLPNKVMIKIEAASLDVDAVVR